jgi:hypothetical protein
VKGFPCLRVRICGQPLPLPLPLPAIVVGGDDDDGSLQSTTHGSYVAVWSQRVVRACGEGVWSPGVETLLVLFANGRRFVGAGWLVGWRRQQLRPKEICLAHLCLASVAEQPNCSGP